MTPALAAAQHDMAVGVATRADDRDLTGMVDAQEVVAVGHGLQGIDGDIQRAVGTVLEADRARQARGHLAVGLGFGGTGADGGPADAVLKVLRGDRVEGFGGQRQAHLGQFDQQAARDVQAFLDLEGVIEVRVVDQAFPADGGTRLLEVDAHHDVEAVLHFLGQYLQAACVVTGGVQVMDGAGADHDQQARVFTVQNALDGATAFDDGLFGLGGQRDVLLERFGGDQHVL